VEENGEIDRRNGSRAGFQLLVEKDGVSYTTEAKAVKPAEILLSYCDRHNVSRGADLAQNRWSQNQHSDT